ncbi:MAG: glycosyltransferase [Elusimicrobiota bacterium]
MLSVSAVVPTYNERENIVILARQIHEALAGREHEILVVDDRSPDGTGEAVEALAKDIPGLSLVTKERREGIGAALRYGYDRARCDVLVSMDADLSFSTRDITLLIERIEAGYDLVLGCRHTKGGEYETPTWKVKLKYLISRLGNLVVGWMTGLHIHDFSANFRAIRRGVWRDIQTQENTNSLLLEMILKVNHCGYKIAEVPVAFADRLHGESKLNLAVEAPKFLAKLVYYTLKFRVAGARR